MAVAFDDVKSVCQEAFYLLRQDASSLTQECWDASSPIEVAKCRLSVETAVHEILDEAEWSSDVSEDNVSEWPRRLRNALVYCLVRELSVQIAGRTEDLKLYDSLYRDKLMKARVADLEEAKSKVTDPDARKVLAMVRFDFDGGERPLPRSIKSIVDRICEFKESARHAVLLAHNWNFAKVVEPTESAVVENGTPYVHAVPLPRRSIRLIGAYGHCGDAVEWRVENGYICARSPFRAVKYVRDVPDVSRWSEELRNVYVLRLAADVAMMVVHDKQAAQAFEMKYVAALADAKLHDTQESSTPTDAWGDNYYVAQMRGRRHAECDRRCDPVPWR